MLKFFTSSIGKKLIMSLTGLFLIVFLAVHLFLNLLLFGGEEVYNAATHFMETNPLIFVMQYVLAGGFLLHMLYALVLSYQNMKARPVGYAVTKNCESSSWASRNMLITGATVLLFLVIHLMNFFIKMKFGEEVEGEGNDFGMVVELFTHWYYTLIYVIWFILLYFHLDHAFQSAFQTMGLNNKIWLARWKTIGTIYALIISLGFSVVAIWFFIKPMLG
jgi:succinate dehydrogenase / fumarate reductase cytochrome b subunit